MVVLFLSLKGLFVNSILVIIGTFVSYYIIIIASFHHNYWTVCILCKYTDG
uniref:Uncharacterized protein n=1 Tax=Octopus bimaculoides TaxID=37653 RepID=A0A0L8G4U4_OCTBM